MTLINLTIKDVWLIDQFLIRNSPKNKISVEPTHSNTEVATGLLALVCDLIRSLASSLRLS